MRYFYTTDSHRAMKTNELKVYKNKREAEYKCKAE